VVRRKSLSELEHAEIKLEDLIGRRDLLNEEARILRQERDLVHEKKREVSAQVRDQKGRRAEFIGEARAHRQARNGLQAKAKEFIEVRRRLRAHGTGASVREELRAVKRQVSEMEMRQQTATLTLSEENKLLDALKAKAQRLRELESLKGDEDKLSKEVKDIDASITDLFATADREHLASLEWSEKARRMDAEIEALLTTIATLAAEGDQRHEAFLEARGKADEVHAKIVEMREKVLAERGARRAEAREARDAIRAQNRSVRTALDDQRKLDQSADEALRALFQKGRVEIGR